MGLAIKIYGVSFEDNNIGQVTEALPIESISLGCAPCVYNNENAAICVATITPDNTPDKNVMWSIIDGSSYATIGQDGKITVLSSANGANGNDITIKCVSRINSEVFTTLTIKVKYSNNLETTGIYGYYSNVTGWTKGRPQDGVFADTTLRELDFSEDAIFRMKSNIDYTLSGYAYCTIYDSNLNILATLISNASFNSQNGISWSLYPYKDSAKYVSVSFSYYGTTSTSPILDAVKNAYGNVTFECIKNTDTSVSFANFITID